MTYGIKNIVGVMSGDIRKGYFGTKEALFGSNWKATKIFGSNWTLDDLWTYIVGAHIGHTLDFLTALLCYYVFFGDGSWREECRGRGDESSLSWVFSNWVLRVLAFHLLCESVICGFWHWFTYISTYARGLEGAKFNPANPYGENASSAHLKREIFFSTLGWIQSGAWQVLVMRLWATDNVIVRPLYLNFWEYPTYSVAIMAGVAYWREIHFYWCHRLMHPWWDRKLGIMDGDVGAFLYRHVHALHHKSYNPGPFAGLSMHPIEHFLYYSVAWLMPIMMSVHPLHFLYCKFHADIAPIGGHDGYGDPAGNGDFHWLHHAKFECNYGVPWPINFDRIFGTWVDYQEFNALGGKLPKELRDGMAERRGEKGIDHTKTE